VNKNNETSKLKLKQLMPQACKTIMEQEMIYPQKGKKTLTSWNMPLPPAGRV
jgi:hypothetical protein